MTIVLPARNEAALIEPTLRALTHQRAIDGRRLPDWFFDIVVLANNCDDDTSTVARDIAAQTPHVNIFTVETTFPAADAHIGNARKYALDLAAQRFLAAGKPAGIIASIDADTIAAHGWIAWIAREMHGRDAVAGHVTISAADQEALFAPVRLLYARELAYRRIIAELEALIDPLPEDPQPRHGAFVGASFAVSARCYRAAGGLPPLRQLEDVEFSRALRRIDARVRHSPFVHATTSGRRTARVEGGFGTFISELHACARRGDSFRVEHPLRTLEDMESRAAVRRVWQQQRSMRRDIARISAIFNVAAEDWLPSIDRALPLGTVYERIVSQTQPWRFPYKAVRVESAIATLRSAATRLSAQRAVMRYGPQIPQSLDAG